MHFSIIFQQIINAILFLLKIANKKMKYLSIFLETLFSYTRIYEQFDEITKNTVNLINRYSRCLICTM